MALTGNLETMPLPDILQFVGLGRKTGVLRLEAGQVRKALYIENGRAVYCSSGSAKEYLGQHLLARTAVTESDLERAFAIQRSSGRRLGEILVETGRITAAELDTVLRRKVEDVIYELFTWQAGRFELVEGARVDDDVPLRLSIDWQDLVMEGARRADEMGRIRARIPGPLVRFHSRPASFPEGFPRTGGDRKLVQLVDEGLAAGEICARFHASDFDVLTRLTGLVEQGVFVVDAESLEAGRERTRDEVLQLATRLMQADDLREALRTLRDGAARFPEDSAVIAGLRSCETRLRRQLQAAMADFSAVPVLKCGLDQSIALQLDSRQAYVASRINGSWSVKSIVQLCPFDELDALCIIDTLARDGVIELRVATAV